MNAGTLDPRRPKRKDVMSARDANKDAVRFANNVVQVRSILMEHAIDVGWRDDNPAKVVRFFKSKAPQRGPWPEGLIEACRETAEGRAS